MNPQISTFRLIKRFAPYFKKYKGVLCLDLFCAALTTVCELVFPLIVRYITDMGMNHLESLTIQIILTLGGFYLVLRLIDAAANYYMASVGHVMGAKIETDMRKDLFAHLQELSYSYYDETKIGQLMARITSDLFDVTEFAHHCPEEFFIAFLKILVSFLILCNSSVLLTVIIFAILPLMLLAAMYFNKRMRRAFKKSRNQIGEINSQVEDSLLGVRVVKSFANEPIETEKFRSGNEKFLNIKREMYKYMAGFQSSTRLFDGIMYIAVVVAGSLFMIYGKITPGDLVAYLLYVTTLLTSIRRVVEFTEQFQRGMTGIERFIEVMDAPVEIRDDPGAKELEDVKGDIRFDHVSFRYAGVDEEVLTNINLHVAPGQNIALVGPSGGGKTTLCNLIPRFYEVTSGRILIDGQDIKNITLRSLRSQIGTVQQEVYLFGGTIRENIAYGKPGATDEEIIAAAKKASIHDFIMELPDGYDTFVGERGARLSGGQKQRISIARVFLKNPPILILDEATSALDEATEVGVLQGLRALEPRPTCLLITHRKGVLKYCDRELCIREGSVTEECSTTTICTA